VVELLNDQGRVIGNAGNALILGRFGFGQWDTVLIQRADIRQFAFTVKADDISDQMSLRFTAAASPAPNNIVQVMSITELQAARMVRINGGTFQRENNTITISSFYMGKYEVTQKEWRAVMGNNPSSFKGDNLPVENVTWYDAVEYCNRLSQREGLTPAYTVNGTSVTWNRSANGYRLPTEAEWEYAARGGNGSPGNYIYAGSNNIDEVAWHYGNNGARGTATYGTKAVGTKKPNGLGLYDMSGNVFEWCWDWYGTYASGAQTDPIGASSGSDRVVRGGSWVNSAEYARSAGRSHYNPNNRDVSLGFRLVRP
jgi:formylglycine-generating enzyme required for sulfatase activity